jgi:hypothetical protein
MTILGNSRLEALESGTFKAAVGVTRTYSTLQSAIEGTYLENTPSSSFRISVLCIKSRTDSACVHNSGAWNDSFSAFVYPLTPRLTSYSQIT